MKNKIAKVPGHPEWDNLMMDENGVPVINSDGNGYPDPNEELLWDTYIQYKTVKNCKINFWITGEMYDQIKAYQIINGGLSANEAVSSIVEDFLKDFVNTENYKTYLEFQSKLVKIK